MSSHYFVKEHQEYSLIIMSIPSNEFWKGILAWQPYVMVLDEKTPETRIHKIDHDAVFSFAGNGQVKSEKDMSFPNEGSFLEYILQKHPNNSLFFLVNSPKGLKEKILEFDLSGKSIEIVGDGTREMLVHDKLKKWMPEGLKFKFEGNINPESQTQVKGKWQWVSNEGLFEFRSSDPTWLSIGI